MNILIPLRNVLHIQPHSVWTELAKTHVGAILGLFSGLLDQVCVHAAAVGLTPLLPWAMPAPAVVASAQPACHGMVQPMSSGIDS
jgi:hypothetical protein